MKYVLGIIINAQLTMYNTKRTLDSQYCNYNFYVENNFLEFIAR